MTHIPYRGGALAVQSVIAGDTQVTFGTSPAAVRKLFDAATSAMQQAAVKAALEREGTEVSLSASPEQFGEFLKEDSKFWVELVKSAKVKVE